jgi:hypothetical protein
LFLQLLTVLAEKPPASAGYRGSDLVLWTIPPVAFFAAMQGYPAKVGVPGTGEVLAF